MDGQQPPKQADILLGAVKGVYGPQNTPMLWRYIIAGTKGHFEGNTHPQQPKIYTRLLGELSAIHSMHWRGGQGLMWGARGPFPPAAAIVVAVVMPVVFVLRLLKNAIKLLKLVVCSQNFHFITIIVKHTTIQVTLM
jgi:hypothetical protein